MVELGRLVQAFLLEMDRGLLSAYPGWDYYLVPGRPSKALCFSTEGERSGSSKVRKNVGTKLMTVFARRYFEYGLILTLTSFFSVPKGDTDILMVYNGTSSVMNSHLWAPWFSLPKIYVLARALEMGTFMGDSDIGGMFLNFMLGGNCACLAGVDLTHYVPKCELAGGGGGRHLVWWNRCLMGGTLSPYQMGQGMGHAKEMIMGDPN
jgi:hypothetical protein